MELNQIIEACKNRNPKARKLLYEMTADSIMNICMRYMATREEAQDVFQDTYLTILQKIEQFDSRKGTIGAWTSKIAVNTSLMALRKTKRLVFVDNFSSVLAPTTNEDIIASLGAQEIFHEISCLPDGYRIIFNLAVVEGFSHKEIGDKLNISASTSRSQLARAKAVLRKQIKKNANQIAYEKA